MKEPKNLKATILCQKAVDLLKRHPPETALQLSETEAMNLIQMLEENQLKMIRLNQKLIQAKEQTQIAVKKYTELYDFAPSGYFTLSKEGKIIELDLNGANMLGKERTHLKNCSFGFLVSADTRATFNHFIASIFSSNGKETCEVIISTDGNLPINVHLVGSVTENAEQCYVIAVDITGRKQAEEKIRIGQENMKAIFASAPVGMLLLDEETMIVNSNAVIARLVSRDHGQIIWQPGGNGLGCVHSFEDEKGCGFSPDCPECNLRKGIDQVLKSGISIHGAEIPYSVLINGQENRLWLNVNAEPVLLNGRKHVVVAIDDITGRKQSEEALKLFRSLIEQSNDAIEVIDPATGRFLDANEKACMDLGYSREELLSLKVPDIDSMVDESVFQAIVEELQKSGSTIFESRHRRKDGSTFPVEVNVKYIRHEGNYLVSVARDITEQKRAEEQLQLFRRLLDQSADAIFAVDAATSRFLDVNEQACLSLQYSREELLLRGVLDVQTAMRNTVVWQAHVEELRAKGKLLIEFEALRKDGTCFPVEVNTQFVEIDSKMYVISVVRDITERKRAEKALRESEERYRSLFANSHDAIMTIEPPFWRFTSGNRATIEMFKAKSEEEFLSCEPWKLSPDYQPDGCPSDEKAKKMIEKALNEGSNFFEWTHRRIDGEEFAATILLSKMEHNGKPFIQGTVRDITELKRAEEAILKANRLYAVISQVNQTIVRMGDRNKLFGEVCRIAIEYGKFQMSWIGFVDEETKFVNPVVFAGIEDGYLTKIKKISVSDIPEGRGPAGMAIRTGQHFVCNDIANDAAMAPWKDEALKRGYRSSITLPIKLFGKVIGVFSLYSTTPHFFDQAEIDVLNEVANDISFALETIETEKKRVEAEEALVQQNDALSKLNHFSLELTMLPSKDNLEAFITKQFKEFAGAKVAVFSEFNAASRTTTTKHIEMETGLLEKVVNLLGKHVKEIHTVVSDEMYQEMITERIGTKATLHEATFGAISRPVGAAIQALLKVDRFIGLAFLVDGKLYGTSLLAMKKGQPDPPKEILENFIFLAAVSLRSKQAEEELIKAKEKAEESDQLKSAFLTNISHEIRTPMNGILGFAEILKTPDLTGEQQQEYISTMEKCGVRMLNIIDDIVDLSKIESGHINVSVSETNVNEKIKDIYTFFKPEAEQKGLQISYKNALPDKEAIIKTDRNKLFAIFSNLVKNAIKFTKTGSIEIGYSSTLRPAQSGAGSLTDGLPTELTFFVKDTGIGIRPEQKEFIFERFRQVGESLSRDYQGAGLGLAISKAYVEMLGGKIWAESEEGNGSTFYFTLPYNGTRKVKNECNNLVLAESEEKPVARLKILIVEDDEGGLKFLKLAVKMISKEIISVHNGVEAVKACHDNPDIDLILMDIQMPEMDGYEATRQIRQFNTNAVIIAQTAFALNGDNERAMEAGCNDYISKPIMKDQLMELVQKYF